MAGLQPARPRRALRTRLAVLYGVFCFVSGTVLIAFVDLPLLTVGDTVPVPDGSSLGVPPSPRHETNIHQVFLYSAIALGVLAVLSLPLGWLIAGRALRPLRAITLSARVISAGNLHERLDIDGPYDEFRQLGETLDDLFGRLEAAFEAQRHFVANASHELRTPLTAERAILQVALSDPDADSATLREACHEVLALGARQERLIEALLDLATGERGIEQREVFDLATVVEKAVETRRPAADLRSIDIEVTLTAAPVSGDPRLVESLVANLVENALRHNVVSGRVEVTTTTVAGQASLLVRNTGPAVPPDQVDRLFQPFQRLAAERVGHTAEAAGGHGLGLAIVDAIARAHDATRTASARAGGGLDIEVRFPSPLAVRGSRPQISA
jgi:signal transduction histidine kinase